MRDFLRRKYRGFKKRGHENLTLMVIPHGNSRIFYLQLSKFTIAFSLLLIVAVLSVSGVSWFSQKTISLEVEDLYNTDKVIYNERNQYVQKLEKILVGQNESQILLENILSQFNREAQEQSSFLSSNQIEEKARKEITNESKVFYHQMMELIDKKKKTGFSYGTFKENLIREFAKSEINKSFQYNSDVFSYRVLNLKINQNIEVLSMLEKFLYQNNEVKSNLPYGWPIAGGHITSRYGLRYSPFGYLNEFHLGVDLADQVGTPIYAAADGIVHMATRSGGYGLTVRLNHRFGYKTLYAHMSSILVGLGQSVRKGQMIGRVGATGRTTGPHLHFEVKIDEENVDPMPFLRQL